MPVHSARCTVLELCILCVHLFLVFCGRFLMGKLAAAGVRGRVPEVPRQLQDVINWKMIAAARRWSTLRACTHTQTNSSRAINNIPR